MVADGAVVQTYGNRDFMGQTSTSHLAMRLPSDVNLMIGLTPNTNFESDDIKTIQ